MKMEMATAVAASITINLDKLPLCPKCGKGDMLPFPDETQKGNVLLKLWACSNCLYNLGLRTGELITLSTSTSTTTSEAR